MNLPCNVAYRGGERASHSATGNPYKNSVKFGRVVHEMRADRPTDRQTNRHTQYSPQYFAPVLGVGVKYVNGNSPTMHSV